MRNFSNTCPTCRLLNSLSPLRSFQCRQVEANTMAAASKHRAIQTGAFGNASDFRQYRFGESNPSVRDG
ncbi:unnamed protein product, partial [Nesidiocoris tenuis]